MSSVKKGYWKQKDGTILRIKDMETTHIQNCMRLIRMRKDAEESELWTFAGMMHAEIASELADREAERFASEDIRETYPKFAELEKELLRRSRQQVA